MKRWLVRILRFAGLHFLVGGAFLCVSLAFTIQALGVHKPRAIADICDSVAGVLFFPVNLLADTFISSAVWAFFEWPLMLAVSLAWGTAAAGALRLISRGRRRLTPADIILTLVAAAPLVLGPFICMRVLQEVALAEYSDTGWCTPEGSPVYNQIPPAEPVVIAPQGDPAVRALVVDYDGYRLRFAQQGLKRVDNDYGLLTLEGHGLRFSLSVSGRETYLGLARRLGYSSVFGLIEAALCTSPSGIRKRWSPGPLIRHLSLLEVKLPTLMTGVEEGLYRFRCGEHTGFFFGGTEPQPAGGAIVYLPADDSFLSMFVNAKGVRKTIVLTEVIAGIKIDRLPGSAGE